MSTIDEQEKLTFAGSHSSENCPGMTHSLTFCLRLITPKEQSFCKEWFCALEIEGKSKSCKNTIHFHQQSAGIDGMVAKPTLKVTKTLKWTLTLSYNGISTELPYPHQN